MEVHAHAHTARKKWTHYLWEFIMLFLAVFCGFLAEYQLEHKIEHERGKQYIRSFYEDLRVDTAIFSSTIIQYEIKMAGLSGQDDCFDTLNKNITSDSCLQTLLIHAQSFRDLVHSDRTLQQLKNAGGLRLLEDEDADSILFYDNMLRTYITTETTSYQENQTGIRDVIYSMISNERAMRPTDRTRGPLVYKGNKDLLNRFFNMLADYTRNSQANLDDLRLLKIKATSLMHYFEEKYHLH